MSGPKITNTRHQQLGVGLIEILITVLIFSIGMLGLAGLQLMGLRNSQAAVSRSQANFAIQDIIERIRANRDAAAGGSYDLTLAANPTATNGCQANAVANCDPAQLAADDLGIWMAKVKELTLGDASIVRTNGSDFKITIQWDDNRSGAANQTFVVEFSL
ncbi:type IV pilus modification protein PilV [Sedimenticola sp.]|uniref:type IV pilus modification protein PilV n=1 Tax=Sedimenticola sp. TaxID=1940285 RepID=UPI003D0F6E11